MAKTREHEIVRRRLTIRNLLLLLLIGEIIVIVGFTWWLWYRNGQTAVAEVEKHLGDELTARVHQHIQTFTATPPLINQINADAYLMGRIQLDDVEQLEEYFWRQLKAFGGVSYIDVGTEEGDFIGAERMADGTINLELKNAMTGGALQTFKLDETMGRVSKKARPNYDPRSRPWYVAAIQAGEPTWSEIYPFFSLPARLGITAVRPIRDSDGTVRGVLACDLVLSHIDQFLRTLEVGKTGRIFIIERDGMLVASSTERRSARQVGSQLERIHILDFDDDMIRAAAAFLKGQAGDFDVIQSTFHTAYHFEGDRILLEAQPIRSESGLDWLAVVLLPESDFMGPIYANTRTTGFFFVILLLIAGGTIWLTAHQISKPIRSISQEMDEIAAFNIKGDAPETSILHEISVMQGSMSSMKRGLRSFVKYVPVEVVSRLFKARREATLGVERADVTVFLTDIVGFTGVAESLAPDDLVTLMGEYLEEISSVIITANGTVDKYMGDAIMAFWNAPEPVENHQLVAVGAALECQRRLAELRKDWQERGLPLLHHRIGLHSGNVLVGNVGSRRRMHYTVIGDVVNLTHRLEGLNKFYGTGIMISEKVHGHVKDVYLCMPLDTVAVKGKTEGTRIYTVLAEHDRTTKEDHARVELYTQALDLYTRRAFADAAAAFTCYLKSYPDNKAGDAAQMLQARCTKYQSIPPPPDWNGVYQLDDK
jgi:adenylate cyclase